VFRISSFCKFHSIVHIPLHIRGVEYELNIEVLLQVGGGIDLF
jgi:hypothetical protein